LESVNKDTEPVVPRKTDMAGPAQPSRLAAESAVVRIMGNTILNAFVPFKRHIFFLI